MREGTLKARPRSQMQVAFSPIEGIWFLVGASPDLRTQILATAELRPSREQQGQSPIAGVFLVSAEVESVLGLLHLREFQNFFVFATSAVQRLVKNENRMMKILDRASPPVQWQMLSLRGRIGCHLSENPGDPPTFFYTSVPTGGCYPDFASEDFRRAAAAEEASVGLVLEQDGKKVFIAPSVAGTNSYWAKTAANSDLVLIDGTFWSDDELIKAGVGEKTARELGHLPLSGLGGILAQYPEEGEGRKILINLHHTNPILDEASEEHRAVLDAGFEIAHDGMKFEV
jgi:pyrroloquinoline quinone biosynthesis protein B